MHHLSPASGCVLLAGPQEMPPLPRELIEKRGWLYGIVHTTADALRQLRRSPNTDAVLIVPGRPLHTWLELCRNIKFDGRTNLISVVFLLTADQAGGAQEAFEAGADDCVNLSAPEGETLIRLTKAIHLKQATDSLEDSNAVITALANAVEGKDSYTCGHVERVGSYAVRIGQRAGIDTQDLEALRIGGVVHDIGKIGIPDQILNKPGKLTDEEMAVMRRHPVIGYDILKPLRTFRDVLPIVRWHHEKPNGKGYPDGLAGDEVPLLARITAVADCFDALSTDRPYRPAFPLAKCREILTDCAAKGDLDEKLVRILFEILEEGMPLVVPQTAAA